MNAPRASLPVRALRRVVGAVLGRCNWLDALAYRLLALRYAARPPQVASGDAIHFFVGSLALGGAQRQLVTLLRFLVGRGRRCKVWVQERRSFYEAAVEDTGAAWECLFDSPDLPTRGGFLFPVLGPFRSRSLVWTALALAARLRRERPAVLQCLLDTTNVSGALGGRMAGVPVVVAGLVSLHPAERRGDAATPRQRSCYGLLRPSLVDALIANSESGRASFLRWQPSIPSAKVRVVRSGLDPTPPSSATDAEIRRRLDLSPDVPLVLWAGRLAPEKRLDVLLHACVDLAGRGRPFVVLIAGEGRERPTLVALANRWGLSAHVHFVGLRKDLPDLLRLARATVLTSEIEGFPSILLEAQLAGCPVVATRAGGAPELVEDGITGFLAAIGDHAAIASHLARLIDDPALAADMGRAGAERSRRLFGATRMGEETLQIYRQLAEERRPSPS